MKGGPALLAAAGLAAALCAAGSFAADEGAYLGAALGQSKLKDWCDTGGSSVTLTSCEATDTAWKLFGGYRFNRYFAAEASYIDWGETTASTASASVSAKQRSYGIAGVGSVQLAPQFAVFGKLGFVHTEQETQNPTSTVDRDETELQYGLGARYALGPNWALRAEWENTDKLKVQLISFGAEYQF